MTWIDDAKEAIKESSEHSTIYIGADSVRFKKGYNADGSSKWFARYATVIIVHKDTCHGCQVFHSINTIPDYGQIRTRMLQEVQYSIEAAEQIIDILGKRKLEIHIDVNPDPKHASKEAAGWVMGRGFKHKIKNEAWAASSAADYCARGRLH